MTEEPQYNVGPDGVKRMRKPGYTGIRPHGKVPSIAEVTEAAQQQSLGYEARIANQKAVINRLLEERRAARRGVIAEISDRFAQEEDWNAVRKLERWSAEITLDEVVPKEVEGDGQGTDG